jgi:hypothetical protein
LYAYDINAPFSASVSTITLHTDTTVKPLVFADNDLATDGSKITQRLPVRQRILRYLNPVRSGDVKVFIVGKPLQNLIIKM